MTGAFGMTAGGTSAGRDRLVAALLVVALLVCHGALGALHQASSRSTEGGAGGHHVPAAGSSAVGHHQDHHAAHVVHADYAAALFVVLLGAAFVLLSDRSPARGVASLSRLFGRAFLPLFLRPPRGPTLPLLQVFRL